jgi:hypothetical protein
VTNYLGDREPHASRGPHVGQRCRKARKKSMEAPNSEINTELFAVLLHSCVLLIDHTYA